LKRATPSTNARATLPKDDSDFGIFCPIMGYMPVGRRRHRMVAPPAVVAAIDDALRPLGVPIDAVPIAPARLRALIREAEACKGAGS
jgi:hypothetical protein